MSVITDCPYCLHKITNHHEGGCYADSDGHICGCMVSEADALIAAQRAIAAQRLREYRQARDLQRSLANKYFLLSDECLDHKRAAREYHALAVILLQTLRLLGISRTVFK